MIVEILQPRSASYSFQGNVKYPFMRVIKRHFILNDDLHQSIIRDTSGRFLMAAALNNMDQAGNQTTRSSSLLLFLYFFQAFYFQRIYLSRLLVLHNFFRTEGCISPQLKPPAKTRASTKPGSLPSRRAVLESTKGSVQLSDGVSPLVPSVLSSF